MLEKRVKNYHMLFQNKIIDIKENIQDRKHYKSELEILKSKVA